MSSPSHGKPPHPPTVRKQDVDAVRRASSYDLAEALEILAVSNGRKLCLKAPKQDRTRFKTDEGIRQARHARLSARELRADAETGSEIGILTLQLSEGVRDRSQFVLGNHRLNEWAGRHEEARLPPGAFEEAYVMLD